MLDIVAIHLKRLNIRCHVIQGNIPAKKRMEFVDQFNNDPDGPEVMLVSLRAGGCGLNLIGGNHLYLLDSHWYVFAPNLNIFDIRCLMMQLRPSLGTCKPDFRIFKSDAGLNVV